MMEQGGSFVKELGAAWYVADPINKAKLCLTFEHYFVKYGADNSATVTQEPITKEKFIQAFEKCISVLNSEDQEESESLVHALNSFPALRTIVETTDDFVSSNPQ